MIDEDRWFAFARRADRFIKVCMIVIAMAVIGLVLHLARLW